MSDEQLLYVYRLLGHEVHPDRVMLYAFMHFAGLHIVKQQGEDIYIISKGRTVYPVRKDDLISGAMQLEFIGLPSTSPVRLSQWKGHPAVNPELREFPFGHYLQVENYFQAFLQSENTQCLREIAALLYHGFKGKPDKTLSYNLISWIYGIKQHFASEFPDLFQPTPKGGENDWPDMKAITEAEIRALNGGDITKTDAILAADTWGALAELNAKAKEAAELERISKK